MQITPGAVALIVAAAAVLLAGYVFGWSLL
jgi:hypothetical protein